MPCAHPVVHIHLHAGTTRPSMPESMAELHRCLQADRGSVILTETLLSAGGCRGQCELQLGDAVGGSGQRGEETGLMAVDSIKKQNLMSTF